MAPPDESLYIGDVVEVLDMPEETGLNGITGTLVKPVGKGRWSLKVDGEEKSKVVPTPNLRKVNMKGSTGPPAGAPDKYSIVGTWDDWEPQDMFWNPASQCFEFTATMGTDGSESFKILQNGDWDGCVYPDRKDATPYDDHKVHGPDDGGLNEEWTIGFNPKDKATVGSRFKVTLHVLPDGKPTRVHWEPAQETQQARQPAMKLEEPEFASAEMQRPRQRVSFAAEMERRQSNWDDEERLTRNFGGQDRQPARPTTWEHLKRQEEDVEEVERKARERLMARFAAANEAQPLAIEDDGYEVPNWAEEVADRQRIDRLQQVEANRQRYRRSIAEATRKPGDLTSEEATRQMQNAVRQCVECGKMGAAFFGNGVCEPCWKAWEKIQEKGEQTDVIPSHLPAGLRIYLRMQKSQMNAGEREDGGEAQEAVTNDRPKRRAAEARKKVKEQAAAAANDEDDPYWDEIPLPK